ncbi:MAG: hypothetical protein CMJ62_14020 [Planctomycetaceae bacterium]|nr:hypothetical protein [Planctomycetaceae bacterium]
MPFNFDQLEAFLPTLRSLWIMLWSGLAALTVALLIVTRTRWGQTRPLSKCVVLSVFSHLLLTGYAYKTQLFSLVPFHAGEKSIRVTLVSSDAERPRIQREQVEVEEEPLKPWNKFSAEKTADPQVGPVLREDSTRDREDLQRERPDMEPVDSGQPSHPPMVATDSNERVFEVESAADRVTTPATTREALTASPIVVPRRSNQPTTVEQVPVEPKARRVDVSEGFADLVRSPKEIEFPLEQSHLDTQIDRIITKPVQLPEPELSSDLTQVASGSAASELMKQPEATADELFAVTEQEAMASRKPAAAVPLPGTSSIVERDSPSVATSPEETPSPVRLADGEPIPEVYQGRLGEERSEVTRRGGGSILTESSVESALGWLAANQQEDGRWDASQFGAGREQQVLGHDRQGAGIRADTGVTGLALLAFLGAGQTHYQGAHRKTVQWGLEYLLRTQRQGNLGGDSSTYANMYCHSMALFAICEAYAMTGDQRMRPYVQRGVDYSLSSQNRSGGGWRYRPGDQGDMSQFGWQVMALKSAALAGIHVPREVQDRMYHFLDSCSSGQFGGLASYRPGQRPSRTMTAEGLLCRLFLDVSQQDPSVAEAARYIGEQLPGEGKPNLYYWYYATLALHQLGDQRWDRWNVALKREILGLQRSQGALAGSWDPQTVWGGYGGRVYTTAMAALCLEVYYRYALPTSQLRQAKVNK